MQTTPDDQPSTMALRSARQIALVCAAVSAGGPALAADAGAALASVKWMDGGLSIKPSGQPLRAVLRAIESRAGVEFKGIDALTAPVSRGVERVSLVDGLRYLLADQSYLIIGGSRDRPTRVIVVGGLQANLPLGGAAAQVVRAPAAAASPVAALERAAADADPAVRIEAVERLGDLDDERSLAVVHRAMSDSNEGVRAVAKEALEARRIKSPAGRGELTR